MCYIYIYKKQFMILGYLDRYLAFNLFSIL
jgi:hypothetical protein